MIHSKPKRHMPRWQSAGYGGMRTAIAKSKKITQIWVCAYPGCTKIKKRNVEAWFLK